MILPKVRDPRLTTVRRGGTLTSSPLPLTPEDESVLGEFHLLAQVRTLIPDPDTHR